LYAQGDTAALDAAFGNPPKSTREILHPGEFQRDRRAPLPVEPPPLDLPGWRRIGDNVVGEFGIRVLLSGLTNLFHAQAAAQGWRGDRYHVYEKDTNGPVAVVWVTAWDDDREAAEFEQTYRSWLKKQTGPRPGNTRIERAGPQVSIRYFSDTARHSATPTTR
jgi:hypothetical protein